MSANWRGTSGVHFVPLRSLCSVGQCVFRAGSYVCVVYAEVHYLESFENWDLYTISKHWDLHTISKQKNWVILIFPVCVCVCVKEMWVFLVLSSYHKITMTVYGVIMCMHYCACALISIFYPQVALSVYLFTVSDF